MLSIDPLISPTLWITLAIASAILLGIYARRRPGNLSPGRWAAIISLMGISLALVLAILLNPIRVMDIPPPPGKPHLTVLVDSTASMATPDSTDGQTRFAAAARIARAINEQTAGMFDVRVASFSDTVRPATPTELDAKKPDGQLTDLAQAISSSIEPDLPQSQALVLLTDGIPTTDNGAATAQNAARLAKAMNAPIYTRALGGQGAGMDLSLELPSPQEIAFMGQTLTVHAMVKNRGITAGEATVRLLADGKQVDQKTAKLTDQGMSEVTFDISQAKPGIYKYECRVDSLPRELTEVNNSAALLLRVVDQPVRVLVLEGKPYWDSKFLVRTLSHDAAVEVHSLVKVAPGRIMHRVLARNAPNQPAPATQPAGEDTWEILHDASSVLAHPDVLRTYQVLVIGRETEEFLDDATLATIQNWISHDGGSLVCFRGAPVTTVNQNLARILPVKWTPIHESRFHLALTDQGRDLNLVPALADGSSPLTALPALVTLDQVQFAKPLSVTLATAAGGTQSPAVTYQPYGSGRCVVIEGAGMWRWAFLPPQQQQNDGLYGMLWHGLFRWLVSNTGLPPGENSALRADKISFSVTEGASATLLTRADAGPAKSLDVELTGPGIPTPKSFTAVPAGDDPGTYRVMFGLLPEGRYQARLAGDTTKSDSAVALFDVRSFGEEQLNLTARPDLLAQLANASGGAVLNTDKPDELMQDFRQHLQNAGALHVIRATAWDRWWVLTAVFVCWCISWGLRRASGLI